MTDQVNKKDFQPVIKRTEFRANWLFEVEPYSRSSGQTISELRDNLRLKRAMKRAIANDMAPLSLIERIRSEIRA